MVLKYYTIILILVCLIISVGFFGIVFNKKHVLLILLSIEILFLAINLNFVVSSICLDDILGQIFVLFNLTIIGCESVMALALLFLLKQLKQVTNTQSVKQTIVNKK